MQVKFVGVCDSAKLSEKKGSSDLLWLLFELCLITSHYQVWDTQSPNILPNECSCFASLNGSCILYTEKSNQRLHCNLQVVLLVFFVYFSDGCLSCHDRKWLKETPNNCHYGRIMQVCQILLVKRLPVPRFQRVRNSLVMHWGGRLLRFNPKTCRMRDLWCKSSQTLRRRQEITAQASEELSVQASRKQNKLYKVIQPDVCVCNINWL